MFSFLANKLMMMMMITCSNGFMAKYLPGHCLGHITEYFEQYFM